RSIPVNHLWKSLVLTAFVAIGMAASAKADIVVADGNGNSCVIGRRGTSVIRNACFTGTTFAFLRECKVVAGTDGCGGRFLGFVFRLFETKAGVREAIVSVNGGPPQRFIL
ncbi:MAG TPA: hypothetical protein VH639_07910, partial [Bryobacteraceae bacterium]